MVGGDSKLLLGLVDGSGKWSNEACLKSEGYGVYTLRIKHTSKKIEYKEVKLYGKLYRNN